MEIQKWAQKWNINPAALQELYDIFNITPLTTPGALIKSEADVSNLVIKEASEKGARLWRNKSGATYTNEGSFIRYGIANDSERINKIIKSSDLIGIKPVSITSAMVGKKIGQFLCREIKRPAWKFTGTERETAQLRWLQLINSFGGDACFATNRGTINDP